MSGTPNLRLRITSSARSSRAQAHSGCLTHVSAISSSAGVPPLRLQYRPSVPPSNPRPSPDSGWRSGAFHFRLPPLGVSRLRARADPFLPCGARYHRYAKLPLERGNINLNALFRGFIHEIQAQNGVFLYLQYLQSEDEAGAPDSPRPPRAPPRTPGPETRNSRAARSSSECARSE